MSQDSVDRLTAITQALVRSDSQTPPSDTRDVVAIAQDFLKGIPGVILKRYISEEPVENLVAVLDGGLPGPRTILSGHLDTYPIGDISMWKFLPLGGEIGDGFIYGRGAADMKGGVAVLVEILADWAKRRPFAGSLVLALAGDEERMGELGTQWLMDNAPEIHGDGVLVADVGGPFAVRLGEKGMLWLEIEAEGKQAHSAHVYVGVNAADRLVDALIALRKVESLIPEPPEDARNVMALAARKTGESEGLRRTMERVTVNVGMMNGGSSPNLVPARASAAVDIRIPLGLSTAEVEKSVDALLGGRPGVAWTITRRYEPSWTDSRTPLAAACLDGARKVSKEAAVFDNRIGGSDARLWRRGGYPCVVIGLTPRNLGAPDEACHIGELSQLHAVYDAIIGEIHGQGVVTLSENDCADSGGA
ncbi:M20/M25/M40 family metallo-hydrolase [Nitratireductor soli]|uniref:M20/M25/M40 family metallo-hydrolase n=1 Tax=Nitratireductor soli TaxID=1670619 RepID=UPI00065E0F90|nr:M20/M25/M40 family metallo-hydrolase [Nitratireductor soli]